MSEKILYDRQKEQEADKVRDISKDMTEDEREHFNSFLQGVKFAKQLNKNAS